ncbi:putative membrane protein [Bacillus mesophilus]|uniref:DUF2243 domain-containing protein n=1 Tax=Bacillus mesophilus TaxID=1808955 RepID=A0A6M0Q8A7_9BACI|nr:hypothetical protein [Bacillus mesophilus]MBM7662049.1 putative membrane protein [Bacillus mesophilus]NEY72596.1 hypothetical protein [Bacillus mesophilus]
MRILGVVFGYLLSDLFFHLIHSSAAGLKAETQGERIGAVLFGVFVLLILMFIAHFVFSKSFFQGFVVATGLFLSFDIVVFHWIFQLHRITNGPEANWLEPILVVGGIVLIWYGIKRELISKNTSVKEVA